MAENQHDGLIEIYKRLRPGEPPTVESASMLIDSLFFDPKRYDLARVGRYKFNKKLSLAKRIQGYRAAENLFNPETGEVLAMEGDTIDEKTARAIQNAGVNFVHIYVEDQKVKVVGNHFVDAKEYLPFAPEEAGINELVYYPAFKKILEECGEDAELLKEKLKENHNILIPKHIIVEDMFATCLLYTSQAEKRLTEARHMGLRRAVLPYSNMKGLRAPEGMELQGVKTLSDALGVLFE